MEGMITKRKGTVALTSPCAIVPPPFSKSCAPLLSETCTGESPSIRKSMSLISDCEVTKIKVPDSILLDQYTRSRLWSLRENSTNAMSINDRVIRIMPGYHYSIYGCTDSASLDTRLPVSWPIRGNRDVRKSSKEVWGHLLPQRVPKLARCMSGMILRVIIRALCTRAWTSKLATCGSCGGYQSLLNTFDIACWYRIGRLR